MGKFPQSLYTDTETDNTSSSAENLKKRRKSSILKHTSTASKKKKCRIHSVSEPDDSDHRSRSVSRGRYSYKKKLQGILKHTSREEKERYYTSSEEDDDQDYRQTLPPDKFLVGRVPQPAGKPGRGGGMALLVRKANRTDQNMQPKQTSNSSKKTTHSKRLIRKRSY